MTRLWNDPAEFADEMADGFALAHPRHVKRVSGGVVRARRTTQPTVSVVIGGGSGHYPAFGGLVGTGVAHAAVMGNVFASPSADHVEKVARIVDRGAGVLLGYGNYAGDLLNFTAAQDRLRAEGVDCRTVVVTDDIFSASDQEREKRRGIAGGLTVYKIAGAAAEAGYNLDEVERLASLANERTRSMGVAFTGCTLPGATAPLFTVPEGRMAIGLGIHGEPGVDEADIPTADGLAELFVDRLLREVPDGIAVSGARVVPILNGLGSVKHEELYVVYRGVAARLEAAGLVVHDPQVGEYCTSFEMAGVSLTLLWLDEQLERLWDAPADTPAFRTGRGEVNKTVDVELEVGPATTAAAVSASTDASRAVALVALEALRLASEAVDENVAELGRLDSIAGDGDHGIGMQRGCNAAVGAAEAAVANGAGAETTLARAAEAWANRAGGTSGALWSSMLCAAGRVWGDSAPISPQDIAAGVLSASQAVLDYGSAEVGDKTMVDALVPFAMMLKERVDSGADLTAAWLEASHAADRAARATADLLPMKGRARTHGDRAVGSPDPGAVSFALIVRAVEPVLKAKDEERQRAWG